MNTAMVCKNCENEVSETAVFCEKCGEQVRGEKKEQKVPASLNKRLINYIVDRVGMYLLLIIAMVVLVLVGANEIAGVIIVVVLYLVGYHIFFESIWQRTPGKWMTSTKVVRMDGGKPSFGQIVGRSFARLIPFEAFSFLFSNHPVGWHDKLTKTLVVPADYTTDDLTNINWDETKKMKSRHGNKVVIVVIIVVFIAMMVGIFSSVFLSSVNTPQDSSSLETAF